MNKFLLSIFLLIFFSPHFTNSQSDYWTQTNGPFGGTVCDYSFGEPNIVYAATDNGVYKSIDNGVSWSSIGLLGNYTLSVCKLTSGTLLAGVYTTGLFRSTNEGVNWSLVGGYAPTIYDIKEIKGYVLIATSIGLLKSLNEGIDAFLKLSVGTVTSIDTSSNDEIYVSTYDSGIFKSINSGENWVRLATFNRLYTLSVDIAPNGYIFASDWNEDIWRSTNNGLSFTNITPPGFYKATRCLATSDGYLYCGTFYTGIWRSSDYGENWQKQYIGERYDFYVWNLCEGFNGNIFAGVDNCGAVRSIDHGQHWNKFRFRNSYLQVKVLLLANDGKILSNTGQVSIDNGLNWTFPDYYFLPTSFALNNSSGSLYSSDGSAVNVPINGIFKSLNNGVDWKFIDFEEYGFIRNVYVSGNGNVYANGYNLYMSTNDGLNWISILTLGFNSIAVNQEGHIFGKRIGGLFRSTNNGSNWENVLSLSDINGAVYSADNGDLYSGGNGTLFKSTNDGDSWTQENITGPVSSIVENQSGRIFVSVYGVGVFMKVEDSWTNITHNLSNSNVTSLCFNDAGQLLAGTTTGVYRTNASVIAVNNLDQNIPDKFKLYQNYPNPFNPVTHLEFGISNLGFVSLKVYNALSKEVKILVNEIKPAGNYEVEFDGSDLPSGIYFYKLQCGDFVDSKRMILLK